MSEVSDQLVSIIIPCYRHGKFLGTAIDSALGQTHPAVEVIVVNDGSDDNSESVAHSYGDRIKYFYKANGGLSSARNLGMDNSRGKYLVFLDADDVLHAEAVSWLVTATRGAADAVALMGFQDFTHDPDRDAGPAILPFAHRSFLASLLQRNFAVHAHMVARDLVLKAGRFDESMRYCEDWDLWARVACLNPQFITIPFVGAFYRRTPHSLSTTGRSMVSAATKVALHLFGTVCADPSQLTALGPPLLRLLYAVRRRARAWSNASAEEERLSQAIRSLWQRGIRVREPWLLKLQDSLPEFMGNWVERVGFETLRRLYPRSYHDIRHFR